MKLTPEWVKQLAELRWPWGDLQTLLLLLLLPLIPILPLLVVFLLSTQFHSLFLFVCTLWKTFKYFIIILLSVIQVFSFKWPNYFILILHSKFGVVEFIKFLGFSLISFHQLLIIHQLFLLFLNFALVKYFMFDELTNVVLMHWSWNNYKFMGLHEQNYTIFKKKFLFKFGTQFFPKK